MAIRRITPAISIIICYLYPIFSVVRNKNPTFNKKQEKSMGETFNKKEKEKKRLKERQEKKEKMQERKANATKKSLDDMMAYIDENGNISSTPPDPRKMKTFKQEDMQISVPKYVPGEEADAVRKGVVTFFNQEKGFGFIKDSQTGESIFVHANSLSEPVKENNILQFEVEAGPKGLNAVNVKKVG